MAIGGASCGWEHRDMQEFQLPHATLCLACCCRICRDCWWQHGGVAVLRQWHWICTCQVHLEVSGRKSEAKVSLFFPKGRLSMGCPLGDYPFRRWQSEGQGIREFFCSERLVLHCGPVHLHTRRMYCVFHIFSTVSIFSMHILSASSSPYRKRLQAVSGPRPILRLFLHFAPFLCFAFLGLGTLFLSVCLERSALE